MRVETIGEILMESLVTYDAALATIRQCISGLEEHAEQQIKEIQNAEFETAESVFSSLQEIQAMLAKVSFQHNIPLGRKLDDFVREFDRLDEPHIREYWHRKFAAGGEWPSSE